MGDTVRRASYPEAFLKAVESKKFHNPETGNEVVFSSLSNEEQKRHFEQWSKSQKGDEKPKPKKKPTFEAARKEVFSALEGDGWSTKGHLKVPQATKTVGNTTVLLHFKPQSVHVEVRGGGKNSDLESGQKDQRSMWVDIRDVAGDADSWVKKDLPKLITHFTKVKMAAEGERAKTTAWVSRADVELLHPRLASRMAAAGFASIRASLLQRLIARGNMPACRKRG